MILMSYASSEGQTRRIARHIADRIAATGQRVELLPLSDAGDEMDLSRFSGVTQTRPAYDLGARRDTKRRERSVGR